MDRDRAVRAISDGAQNVISLAGAATAERCARRNRSNPTAAPSRSPGACPATIGDVSVRLGWPACRGELSRFWVYSRAKRPITPDGLLLQRDATGCGERPGIWEDLQRFRGRGGSQTGRTGVRGGHSEAVRNGQPGWHQDYLRVESHRRKRNLGDGL